MPGFFGNLLEEKRERRPYSLITSKRGVDKPPSSHCLDDFCAVDRQIANAERRLFRKLGMNARLEALVGVVALGEARPDDIGVPERELPLETIGPDAADKAPQRRLAEVGIGNVHVIAHQGFDLVDHLTGEACAVKQRACKIATDLLVPIEVRPLFGSWFSHVMQEGGKAQNEISGRRGIEGGVIMIEHIESVPLVLLDTATLDHFREKHRQDARLLE